MRFLILLAIIVSSVFAENVDLNLNTDKSGWVNLLDPFSSDLATNSFDATHKCDNKEEILRYQQVIYSQKSY